MFNDYGSKGTATFLELLDTYLIRRLDTVRATRHQTPLHRCGWLGAPWKAAEEKRQQEILEEAQALAKKIEAGSISLKIKAGEGGRTFGSVSTKEIAVAMKDQLNLEIDKKKMQLADPIKNFGTYHVPIRLHPKVTAEITVKVEQA